MHQSANGGNVQLCTCGCGRRPGLGDGLYKSYFSLECRRKVVDPTRGFGVAMRTARARLGLSQSALGVNIGASKWTVNSYEYARHCPPAHMMLVIADALDLEYIDGLWRLRE